MKTLHCVLKKEEEYEQVCSICTTLMKREHPEMKGCAYRCLGNEYCERIKDKAKEYGFNFDWINDIELGERLE